MRCQFNRDNSDDGNVSLDEQVVLMNDIFWYLGSMLQSDGGIDENISDRIRAGWVRWRQAYDILYDKKVPNKLKGKFYKMTIKHAMMYDTEC
jgi:hypothetical protein